MRADEVSLQLADVGTRDAYVGEVPDAGVNGVGDTFTFDEVIDDCTSAIDCMFPITP